MVLFSKIPMSPAQSVKWYRRSGRGSVLLAACLPTRSINEAAARCHREDTARLAIYVERYTSAYRLLTSPVVFTK